MFIFFLLLQTSVYNFTISIYVTLDFSGINDMSSTEKGEKAKGMKKEYIEKIYAGWLAKVIGVRYGAPVESWTYEKIKKFYGTLDDYPQHH